MAVLVLCYDKCTTCQRALKWLDKQGVDYRLRPIREENPTAAELESWQKMSKLPLKRFFNTSGMAYRALNLKDRLEKMDDKEKISLLASDGMLVKRPLLLTDRGVFPGFREAEWAYLLGLEEA